MDDSIQVPLQKRQEQQQDEEEEQELDVQPEAEAEAEQEERPVTPPLQPVPVQPEVPLAQTKM